MEIVLGYLQTVWNNVVSWYEMIEDGTGIPIWEYIITFALLAIVFRHLVFPMISTVAGSSDKASGKKKGKDK